MGLLRGYIERFKLMAHLSVPEIRVFLSVADCHEPEIRCGRIIKETKFSKLKVSRALSSLKKKGLLAEDKYAHDKRQCNIYMTQAGRNLKLDMLEAESKHTHTEENYEDKKKRQELASRRSHTR